MTLPRTMWTGVGSGMLISIQGKLCLFYFSTQIFVVIDMKKDGSALDQKSPLRCWD